MQLTVDDARGAAQDALGAVRDGLVDAPELGRRRRLGDRHERDLVFELGVVRATKGELPIDDTRLGRGHVRDAERVAWDRALREEVVRHGGHSRRVADGVLREVNGADTGTSIQLYQYTSEVENKQQARTQ